MNALASTLVTERKRRGLTQAQVAASIGVSRAYIVHLEKGQELKRSRALTRLTQLYGVDAEAISSQRTPKKGKTLNLSSTEEALVFAVRLKNEKKAFKLAITITTGQTLQGKLSEKVSALAPVLVSGRKKKEWTQREAAKQIGIASSSLSAFENGAGEPSPHVLKKMAMVYDLDFEELLRLNVNKGIAPLSKPEQVLIEVVRLKDASKALRLINELIHA